MAERYTFAFVVPDLSAWERNCVICFHLQMLYLLDPGSGPPGIHLCYSEIPAAAIILFRKNYNKFKCIC